LAAVAIPKYIDLSDDARNKAAQAALAAGASNATMLFSQSILSTGSVPAMSSLATSLSTASYQTVGDYTVSYAASADAKGITVTITGAPSGNMPANASDRTKTFTLNPS